MKEEINRTYPQRIQLDVLGAGNNTLHLFQKAQQRVRASANGYRHVWIVYDTDEFPAEHVNETARLCKAASTEETTYHAIWSNQCIEVWFLLHFQYLQANIHRKEIAEKLTNAKRLDYQNANRLPADAAPGTKVQALVEKLKPYLEGIHG